MINKNLLLLIVGLSVASCCTRGVEAVSQYDPQPSAPEMYSVTADEIKKSESGPHILPFVNFATNVANLSDESLATLDETILPEAKSAKTEKVIIEAHCDERGTVEYNQKLSEKRAEAVKKHLIKNGVEADKIKAVGYGKSKPIALGHDAEAWSQNRRAVTIVIKE